MSSTHSIPPTFICHGGRRLVVAACIAVLSACSALQPSTQPQPTFYALDNGARPAATRPAPPASGPTLVVAQPRAAAGYDSQRIIYVREAHKLEYFAHSEWVDPPARMLGPLLVGAAERSGSFRAVVLTPGSASGDVRLDTEVVRLQHEFQSRPSQVHFTLRATLVEDRSRRVIAWRELDATVPARSDDPYGGVLAANLAVQAVLDQLSAFCAEAMRGTVLPAK